MVGENDGRIMRFPVLNVKKCHRCAMENKVCFRRKFVQGETGRESVEDGLCAPFLSHHTVAPFKIGEI